jgi:hypothetical protein
MSHYVLNRYRRPAQAGVQGDCLCACPGSCQSLPLAKAAGRLRVPASAGMTRYLDFLCAQSLTAQLQAAHHTGRFGRDRGLDRPRRQANVRGCRARAQRRRYLQSLRRLCSDGAVLPPGLPVARRQTRRRLRVLRRRYQGRGTAPVLLERRQSRDRAPAYGHVHRQHRAAPRHGRRPPGQGSGRDRAGGIHDAKQRRLDHVRQIPELTASDTGDHRFAAIPLSACLKSACSQSSAATGRFRIRRRPLSLSVGNR